MSKILVAINNLTEVNQFAYANHCQMWYRLGRNMDEHDFGLCNPRRMSIDRMRNFAARAALDYGFDYLLFIDDDVLVPIDGVKRLLEADKDIIAGVTFIRGYPYHPMIFNFYKKLVSGDGLDTHYMDDYLTLAHPETGLLQCDAIGFSFCLIKVSLLRKLNPPFFITGENHTEDVYFCNKARVEVPGAEVWVDTKIETAHILGADLIMPTNKAVRMVYDETLNPGIKDQVIREERKADIIDPKSLRKADYEKVLLEDIFAGYLGKVADVKIHEK